MPKGKYIRTSEIKKKNSDSKKGTHRSEESKRKQSESISGDKNHNYGKQFFGKNNPHWKEPSERKTYLNQAIRSTNKYSEWRVQVFQRDLFICQACKKKSEGDLNAHHIKAFHIILKEQDINSIEQALQCNSIWDISNGITLCEDCHKNIHKNYKEK